MRSKPSLQRLLETEGAPRLIRWGVHEGLRGAQWLILYADGRLVRQRYVPNSDGMSTAEEVGRVPRHRFQEILLRIAGRDFDASAPSRPAGPNEATLSIECVWDEARWEEQIASGRLESADGWARLPEMFRGLSEEACANGEDDPDQAVE